MNPTLASTNWLQGKRVALAGRLASMTRAEAAQLIEAHGGSYSREVTRLATLVVVGRDGWPLARDGRPTKKLRRALALAKQGYDIEILPEEELLARLHHPAGRLQRRFTLSELSQMLEISRLTLNTWLRGGLIEPAETVDSILYFDFSQVAGAKTLCELVRGGITTARLRTSLSRLRQWIGPLDDPLAQLTTLENSHRLVVRLESGQLAEPGGQMLLSFSASPTDALPASLPWVAEAKTAEQWFDEGCKAEELEIFSQAAHAFRQALMAGGPDAETCFNLANVLCSLEQYSRASERYRQVLELDPNFWEAWNNLGTVLTYEGENDEAVTAYRQAIRLYPDYADAHFNLADTLDDLSQPLEATGHWRRYLELEPQGTGADYARLRIAGCSPKPR